MRWRWLDAAGGCSLRRHNRWVWRHGVIRVNRHRRRRRVAGSCVHRVHRPEHHAREVVGRRRDNGVATVVSRRSRHRRLTPHWADAWQRPVVGTAARPARRRATAAVDVVREAVEVQHAPASADRLLVARQRSLHGHVADVVGKRDQRETVVLGDVSALYGIRRGRAAARSRRRAALQGRRADASIARRLETSLQCHGEHHEYKETKNCTRRGNHHRDGVCAQVGEVRTAHDKVNCKTTATTTYTSLHTCWQTQSTCSMCKGSMTCCWLRHGSMLYSTHPPSSVVSNRPSYLELFKAWHGLLVFWHAPLEVRSAIHRHRPPQRTVLGQIDCLVQSEVVCF